MVCGPIGSPETAFTRRGGLDKKPRSGHMGQSRDSVARFSKASPGLRMQTGAGAAQCKVALNGFSICSSREPNLDRT
jgi:hypothetical protein